MRFVSEEPPFFAVGICREKTFEVIGFVPCYDLRSRKR